ncbi:fimbrial protein [Rahnella aceris]|uniref:fimbrial protein n=1 Tax=Rahnella sp. (strain Y9602) TaxID=2703885 RepID=UPI003B9EE119
MHTKKQVLHNLTSLIKLALLGIAINSFSSLAQAGSAMCSPENGAAVSYENFLHEDIPASDNERGKKYEKSMNGGMQNYTIACNCTDKDASSRSGVLLMYTVKTALPKGTEPGYYKINDHIDVKASLDLPPATDVPVPTTKTLGDATHHTDANNNGVCVQQNTRASLDIGSQGSLTFYITTPFIGELDIPRTEIAEIYLSSGTAIVTAPPLGSPVARVYVSGKLTVPQSCEINKGETITVNFGAIATNKFTTLNQPPRGFIPVTFNITYDCTANGLPKIPAGTQLAMLLKGDDLTDQYTLVARRRPSDNKADIGIRVENANGTAIPFESGNLPMNQNGMGNISMTAYPINLIGGGLDTGEFSGMATLKIDIR